jgi:hypothetical protein
MMQSHLEMMLSSMAADEQFRGWLLGGAYIFLAILILVWKVNFAYSRLCPVPALY